MEKRTGLPRENSPPNTRPASVTISTHEAPQAATVASQRNTSDSEKSTDLPRKKTSPNILPASATITTQEVPPMTTAVHQRNTSGSEKSTDLPREKTPPNTLPTSVTILTQELPSAATAVRQKNTSDSEKSTDLLQKEHAPRKPVPASGTRARLRKKLPVTATSVHQRNTASASVPIEHEGWSASWEDGPKPLPPQDIAWVKDDLERGIFGPVQWYTDTKGVLKKRRVLKCDRMWFYPPECPGLVGSTPPTPELFFRSRLFFWRPVGVWRYSIKCPRSDCPGRDKNTTLYRSGYSPRVRHICDINGWYYMLTEVLCCGPCLQAARREGKRHFGRYNAWDKEILKQLSEAHRAMFPAALTTARGVDKTVIQLLRDRSVGNTMSKVWRQIQENHCQEYLNRVDLYTTLLTSLSTPGGIVAALGHQFTPPPQRPKLPGPRLLRHAFLLAEAEHVEDYRCQILSTFGKVLKIDSTKNV